MQVHSEPSCPMYGWQMDSSYFTSGHIFILFPQVDMTKNWVLSEGVYFFSLRWDMKQTSGNNSTPFLKGLCEFLTKVCLLSWEYWHSLKELECSSDSENLSLLVGCGAGSLITFAGLRDLPWWWWCPMVRKSLVSVTYLRLVVTFIKILGTVMASIICLMENLEKMSDRVTSLKLSSRHTVFPRT